ncbi:MAG: carbonic anhydrase [Planctomycetaceae bacterium]|nr:carbonic anhydrase [Planctomycetaceae bacterium]
MEHLLSGVHQFHSQVFQRERDFFDKLVTGQSPSALFVTCSDSRVDPNLITQSGPGELFVLRNAGNIVPPYGASNGGESATIEYAVAALGVRDIVICGHSRCGAINALLHPEQAQGLPLVSNWLNHAETTRRIVTENYREATGEALLEIAVQEHVLVQIENIQTHPSVAVKLQRGELTLHGWVYHLETGEILAYSGDDRCFEPLNKIDHTTAAQRVIDNPMLRK